MFEDAIKALEGVRNQSAQQAARESLQSLEKLFATLDVSSRLERAPVTPHALWGLWNGRGGNWYKDGRSVLAFETRIDAAAYRESYLTEEQRSSFLVTRFELFTPDQVRDVLADELTDAWRDKLAIALKAQYVA